MIRSVVIIGSGNLAEALARAVAASPLSLRQVFGRNRDRVAAVAALSGTVGESDPSRLARADIYLIAVSDAAVAEVASSLPIAAAAVVAHTAGSVPVDALARFPRRAVFYPFQTFTKGREVDFSEIPILVETASPDLRGEVEAFARCLSRTVLYADSALRGQVHLAGVFACNFANHLFELGGEVRFNTALTGLHTRNGALTGIETTAGPVSCEQLILAIGHSARDTFAMLHGLGLPLECKPFSVGFRAEHLQTEIDKSLYHGAAGHPALPKGEYQLSQHVGGGRGVYTFCMCPGGYVVNASSEEHRLAVNGMSYHDRAGENANSAVIVTVTPDDFGSDHPLAGISFQRSLEEKAYQAGQGKIPVQRFGDFKEDQITTSYGMVHSCMKGASVFGDVRGIFPEEIAQSLEDGITAMDHKIHGFADNDALLSGVESRTSSPVRIERDENFVCASCDWIYPCGEGAGYAGGITSAAMDGMKVAEAIIQKYKS